MKVPSPIMYLIVSLFVALATAQSAGLRFRHIDGSSGLSHDWVRCFYQDDVGFVWIGTSTGLDRYDGREIKSFRPLNRTGDEELSTPVTAVIRKNDEELWVGTDGGLYVFNRREETFAYFDSIGMHAVLHLMRDSRGRLWVSTPHGLVVLDGEERVEELFEADSKDPNSLAHDYVNATFEDSSGVVWVGTERGLSAYDEEGGAFTSYRDIENLGGVNTSDVLRVAEDQQGGLWLTTALGGLYSVNKDAAGKLNFQLVSAGRGIRVIVDSDNVVWVGKSGGGLERIDLNEAGVTGEFRVESFLPEVGNEWSLSGDFVYSLYEDRLGDIWAGTFSGGVSYLSKRNKPFGVVKMGTDPERSLIGNAVNSLFEEEEYFWVGTNNGLSRRDKSDGSYRHYRHVVGDETTLGSNPIFEIFKDSRGNLWAGGWRTGLNRYDYETETFERFFPSDDPASLSGGSVYAMLEDDRGDFWVGTLGEGLNRFNYETETFEHYRHDPEDPTSLALDDINDLIQLKSGAIYVSASRHLERFNRETGEFTHFNHKGDVDNGGGDGYILSLFEDSVGRLWLATTTGLEIFDEATGTFERFTVADGLPSNDVKAVVEDAAGNLWVSTSKGLSIFEDAVADPHSARFRNITQQEGLSSDQFNMRAAILGFDGTLYFGSSAGYTYFPPQKVEFDEIAPPVALTDMLLLSESSPNSLQSYRSIGRNVNMLEEVELSYSNSNFVIKFAALNFLNSEKNRYRYMLEGYDDDWINAGISNAVTYTHIPPGEYAFRAMGSNGDGVWAEMPKPLLISVLSPWWEALWFRVGLGLVVIVLMVAFYRIRFAMLERRQSVLEFRVRERTYELEESQIEVTAQNKELHAHRDHLEEMVSKRTEELEAAKLKAEESDSLKSSFLMNMSHEIRTPMNAIIGFSGLLKSDSMPSETRDEFVDVITENGAALIVLIDDILDLSLIQANQVKLNIKTFSVLKVLMEQRNIYRMKREEGKVLRVNLIDENRIKGIELTSDPVRFRQIVGNLLSNAYKFTTSGEIRIGCSVRDGELLFEVLDAGLGIDLQDHEKIFDNFYKVERDNSRLYRGTGIGLFICRKLVAKLGGRIWVESKLGEGARFCFTLPIQESSISSVENPKHRYLQDLSGVTVLVAEDDATNFDLVDYMMKSSNATVHRAVNGQEAVDFVSENMDLPRLVVLMDIQMAVMDGCEACCIIKKMKPTLPVIAVTARALDLDRSRIMEAGFDSFMAKPISPKDLLALVFEKS